MKSDDRPTSKISRRAILQLAQVPKPDHAADALATALCHLHSHTRIAQLAEAERQAPPPPGDETNMNKILLSQMKRSKRRR